MGDLGVADLMEIVTAGGLLVSDAANNTSEKVMSDLGEKDPMKIVTEGGLLDFKPNGIDIKKFCCCTKSAVSKFLGALCIIKVLISLVDVVLEGISFHKCSTAPGVTYDRDLYMWLTGYILLCSVTLPVDIWLLPYFLVGPKADDKTSNKSKRRRQETENTDKESEIVKDDNIEEVNDIEEKNDVEEENDIEEESDIEQDDGTEQDDQMKQGAKSKNVDNKRDNENIQGTENRIKPECWNLCITNPDMNPYCICMSRGSYSGLARLGIPRKPCGIEMVKLCNMRVSIHLLMLFEDIVHMIMATGRIMFIGRSLATYTAYKDDINLTATSILIVVELISFIVRWIQMYSLMPWNVLKCTCKRVLNTIFFQFTIFLASLIAFILTCMTLSAFITTRDFSEGEKIIFNMDYHSGYIVLVVIAIVGTLVGIALVTVLIGCCFVPCFCLKESQRPRQCCSSASVIRQEQIDREENFHEQEFHCPQVPPTQNQLVHPQLAHPQMPFTHPQWAFPQMPSTQQVQFTQSGGRYMQSDIQIMQSPGMVVQHTQFPGNGMNMMTTYSNQVIQ